jgi:hypothetical protein
MAGAAAGRVERPPALLWLNSCSSNRSIIASNNSEFQGHDGQKITVGFAGSLWSFDHRSCSKTTKLSLVACAVRLFAGSAP